MHARVQRWGNSLALRIPRPFAIEAGIEANSDVDLTVENGQLVVRPMRKPSLDDLLSGITDENLHGEVGSGDPVGNEAW